MFNALEHTSERLGQLACTFSTFLISYKKLKKFTFPVCIYSEVAKFSGSNVTEPSPISDSEVYQDNTILLHRLVSEGNVNGVRLVCITGNCLSLFF